MRLTVTTLADGSRKTSEHVYLYLKDLASLEALATQYDGNASRLFAAFESILAADLLNELRVRVKARGVNGSVTFRELSEGEQQLLMVLGLLRFTRSDESLFLLDEPDTHLNPVWSLRYIDMLTEHSGQGFSTSQIVMASHDPLVIASLLASQVCLLERDAETGIVTATRPATDPRGMGVSALLTSEIYGLASELDPATYAKLERRRWLAAADDPSVEELAELRRLTKELEDLDFAFSDRDPLYYRFEKAMSLISRADEPVMTPTATREEEARGLARLREILGEEDADR
jgi:energy-coupling factor transporter ATP-binding protein EcfA2